MSRRSRENYNEAEQFTRDVDALLAGQNISGTSEDCQADLALAKMLSQLHFVPGSRFESRLRGQLLDQLYDKKVEVDKMSVLRMFRSLLRPMVVAGISAMLVLGVVFVVSPEARASARELVARFVEVDSPRSLLSETGERGEFVVDDQPKVSSPSGESVNAPESPDANSGETVVITGDQDVGRVVVPEEMPAPESLGVEPSSELISLEEAQAELDFEIRTPSVLPAGYSFWGVVPSPDLPSTLPDLGIDIPEPSDDLPKVKPPQSVILVFGNDAGERLNLSEMYVTDRGPSEVSLPAGEGSVQKVMVNGQPAQYIAGQWTEDGWVADGQHRLHWQEGDILYDLTSRTLSLEELLAVAESIE